MPKLLFISLMLLLLLTNAIPELPDSKRAADIRAKVWPELQKQMKMMGFRDDQPIYIRIIKETGILEVWILSGKQFKLFKSYLVCYYSGGLGTKTRNGDNKSPEGFYTLKPGQLNPVSNYHLAINVGYPNLLEQQKGYTGNAVMIHGYCASIGCYAMTDPIIEEIYTMVYEAFLHGQQSIELNIFPFKMDAEHMKTYAGSPNLPFWKNLKTGYDMFENRHVPAVVSVSNRNYVFR
ncbi:MAG: L,D-transpeptidase family protein [Mucilaginibacter sp.]